MKINMYSIYDSVMDLYNTPFVAFNDNDAKRILQQATTPETTLWKNTEDFSLHHVTIYDNELGAFENILPPRLVTRAHTIIQPIKEAYEHKLRTLENEQGETNDNL